MEYVVGKTLKQLLKKRGSLTLSEAIDIMLQLTDGMAHAHDSYIIHRDLKPQNILIDQKNQLNIKLADFGLARTYFYPIKEYTHEIITLWYRAP